MKRLRHPIRAIREPFGTAGLIVAMIALVAALGGTALAAAKLNSTQKKEVEKIAKKFQGTGPAGAAGVQGSPGAPGAAGKDGTNGTNGTNGTPGTNGTNGKSVVTGAATSTPAGECPTVGGATVEVEGTPASKKHVCNGTPGAIHPGETLPSEASETGLWGIPKVAQAELNESTRPLVSFPIPLAAPLTGAEECGLPGKAECSAHLINAAGEEVVRIGAGFETTQPPTQCPGNVAEPLAEPGHLCIYAGPEFSGTPVPISSEAILNTDFEEGGVSTAGAFVSLNAHENDTGSGSWAVTAP